jgi:hypothetical protein
VLKATLHEEVAKAVDHQRMGLKNDRIHNLVLLIGRTDLKLLLQKDGSLLVVVANNLVHNVLPVAVDVAVQQATVVERFSGGNVGRTLNNGILKDSNS